MSGWILRNRIFGRYDDSQAAKLKGVRASHDPTGAMRSRLVRPVVGTSRPKVIAGMAAPRALTRRTAIDHLPRVAGPNLPCRRRYRARNARMKIARHATMISTTTSIPPESRTRLSRLSTNGLYRIRGRRPAGAISAAVEAVSVREVAHHRRRAKAMALVSPIPCSPRWATSEERPFIARTRAAAVVVGTVAAAVAAGAAAVTGAVEMQAVAVVADADRTLAHSRIRGFVSL